GRARRGGSATMMFANKISSSTSCSIWLPETSPPSSARAVLRHSLRSCNTSGPSLLGRVTVNHPKESGQWQIWSSLIRLGVITDASWKNLSKKSNLRGSESDAAIGPVRERHRYRLQRAFEGPFRERIAGQKA